MGLNKVKEKFFCNKCIYKNNSFTNYLNRNIKQGDIKTLREKVKILIIDDKKLEAINTLIDAKSYSIYYKNDIKYPIEAEPYDIVIVDIRGVAIEFSQQYQGLGFAIEVKQFYPTKTVLCYSGENLDVSFGDKLKKIDDFIMKTTSSDEWSNILDKCIKEYCSVDHQWNIWETILSDQFNLSQDYVTDIREEYLKAFRNGDFSSLQDILFKHVKDIKFVIDICVSIYNLYKIFNQ